MSVRGIAIKREEKKRKEEKREEKKGKKKKEKERMRKRAEGGWFGWQQGIEVGVGAEVVGVDVGEVEKKDKASPGREETTGHDACALALRLSELPLAAYRVRRARARLLYVLSVRASVRATRVCGRVRPCTRRCLFYPGRSQKS